MRRIATSVVSSARQDAFEAGPGVDVLLRQFVQRAVSASVVLREDEVPELHEAVLAPALGSAVGAELCALVKEDLRARSARSGRSHLPEVVLTETLEGQVALGRADDVDVEGAKALLDRDGARVRRGLFLGEVRLEGHHPRDGEEQALIVGDEARRGHDRMAVVSEVIQED